MELVERTLDRRIHFDERSKAFGMRAILDTTKPRPYTWRVPVRLNQYREGACVGFAWAHEAAARPIEVPGVDAGLALLLYRRARELDVWPGEDYDGTSVIAGAKAAVEVGLMKGFRWSFEMMETLASVSRYGPGVAGVWWHGDMYEPDEKGFIWPTGNKIGGHALVVNGVNVKNKTVTLTNSWGPEWGDNGTAKMTWDAFAYLLEDDGECCFPVKRTFPL